MYNVAVSSGFLIKIALSGQGEEKVSGPYASGQKDRGMPRAFHTLSSEG